jgi:antitoxin PrlF
MKATIAEHGQVTIPKALCEQLGLHSGMTLEFSEENGRLVAVKLLSDDPVAQVYGCLGAGRRTDPLIAELRGEE